MLPLIKHSELPYLDKINTMVREPLKQHLMTPSEAQIPYRRKSETTIRNTDLQLDRRLSRGEILSDTFMTNNKQQQDVITTLDGFVLLASTGLSLPDEGMHIKLPGKKYNRVIDEDLLFFTSLVFLDISDNCLGLAPFGLLPNLQDLRLACNGIRNIDSNKIEGRFPSLLTLDLSYNKLSLESIQALSILPLLKQLDLSGNGLIDMPDMEDFRTLERLILENNKFEDNTILNRLSSATKLTDLFLAYNFLCKFPENIARYGGFRFVFYF